jgi:hypothetical protein
MPDTVKGRRRVGIVLAILAIIIALFAVWKALERDQTATDLGQQVSKACTLDQGDAQRKGLDCAQAQSVAGSPVIVTVPPRTSVIPIPGPLTVLTETQQVPLPLPTISLVQLPGATDTVITITPGPTVTDTVTAPPQTQTETQTQTVTETQTETQTVTETPSSSPVLPLGP